MKSNYLSVLCLLGCYYLFIGLLFIAANPLRIFTNKSINLFIKQYNFSVSYDMFTNPLFLFIYMLHSVPIFLVAGLYFINILLVFAQFVALSCCYRLQHVMYPPFVLSTVRFYSKCASQTFRWHF